MDVGLTSQERADALVLSAVLRANVLTFGAWSLVLSTVALVMGAVQLMQPGLPVQPFGVVRWLPVLLIGLVNGYWVFRLQLDRQLFLQLGVRQLEGLHAMDNALGHLGLRKSTTPNRSWADRVQGTCQLMRQHCIVVLVQTLASILALLL